MRIGVYKTILLSGILINLWACDDKPPVEEQPLVFSTLKASRYSILAGDTTRIQATASGYAITYHWQVEKGDLLGSGTEVIYVATPCTIGENPISCTVIDGYNRQESKQVVITVF